MWLYNVICTCTNPGKHRYLCEVAQHSRHMLCMAPLLLTTAALIKSVFKRIFHMQSSAVQLLWLLS
jgi:hypothetical protein